MSGRRFYLKIRQKLSQLLNPALCLSCGLSIESSAFLCADCQASLERVPNPCTHCALPNPADGSVCPACRHQPPRWQSVTAPLVFRGGARKLIHDLKFNEQIHIANALVTHFYALFPADKIEVLIPVPLHKSRLLERGFNQSEEIANCLSQWLDIPVDRSSLHRIKATAAQSGLSPHKRRKNILKAFEFNPPTNYQSVAIVDDVITTGSTMSEITKVLKRSGISHVEVWSLTRALKHD